MMIDSWIDTAARSHPQKTAVIFDGVETSYQQMAQLLGHYAGLLYRQGVRRGGRVAYLGLNHPDIFILLFACARLGAVFVPVNWRLSAQEITDILHDCTPQLVIHDSDFADLAACLAEKGGDFAVLSSDQLAFAEMLAVTGEQENKGMADEAVLLVYTSGSTGRPKGVLLSQKALAANARMSIDAHQMQASDRVICVLPLFHVGGLNILATPAFSIGATVILHRSFDAGTCLRDCANAELIITVPTILKRLTEHDDWPHSGLGRLRTISIGSTDVPLELIESVHQRHVPVIQIYGATETAPIAVYQQIDEAFESAGAIGRQGCACEIEIRRADGSRAETGEAGEICVRGDNILLGYWQDEEQSRQAIRQGWFHTGDVGLMDAAGLFWFVDRIKHVIISGGENIYPAEIERVLRQHPQIGEVAVVGRADREWGEVPVAVVGGGQAIDTAELFRFLQGRLARYKQPREICFVDQLPRNAMGKIVVAEVKALIAGTPTS